VSLTITHTKTNTIPDWDQQKLDAAISAGLYPQGTRLSDIVLPSDWNASHTVGELSITSCTFANLPSPAGSYTGQQRIVTDCNNSVWVSNGTAWKPVGGRFLHWASTVASGVAPSGTVNTGSSGNVTLGTAIDKSYTYGVFLEFPAIATTPALAAGKYYCVASNTTTLTIYSTTWSGNVPTIGSAINFSAGAAYTGITTRVECYTPNALPGNVMGLGGSVVLEYSAAIKNNANNKAYGVKWGSVTGLGGNVNTNIAGYGGAQMLIQNMGDTAHQTFTPNPMTAPASMGVPGSSAQDTTTAKTVSIGVTMAVATDYYIFQQFNMWVVVP